MELHHYAVEHDIGYATLRRQLEVAKAATRQALLTSVTRIPVVVHIVHATDEQNVSDAQVHAQIDVLNADFGGRNVDLASIPEPFRELIANPKIEFALAKRDPSGAPTSGITRTRTSIQRFPQAEVPAWSDTTAYIDRELKLGTTGAVAWPREHYLNIWVCDMGRNPLGYATFPGAMAWRDGVVIDFTCFGVGGTAVEPFDRGRTAVHEVGHWLDLLHIWGDDAGACTRSDNVGDTPNQGGPNYNVPTFPSISCNNAPHGDLFMNFMDYVDDRAMVMFTKGQVARMHAALQVGRASLLRSPGLQEPEPVPLVALALWHKVAKAASLGGKAPVKEVFDGVSWVRVPGDGEP